MSRYELSGRVALVTGGAQGIGLATARAIHARGASVAIVDLQQEAAEGAAAQIDGERAIGLAADVSDREAIGGAVETVIERWGGIDVVVANAGIAAQPTTARAMDEDAFERVIEVNLLGVWRTVRAALPEIVRRHGHLVVVSSVFAFANGMGAVPYAMSKAGVEQLGRALRAELAQHHASASVAYFGFIDTEMVHKTIDRDPLAERMMATFPRLLHKRLPAAAAGEAIAVGIERRAPRVIRPRRWAMMSALRGLINPLIDARSERDAEVQALLAELDARAAERTPTTA
ncbi:MAG TPA: short-chain dehydrogenase/reductase [Solirubrobacterales bacterium]|nr:short-chain dehydrogenase/reductase [Solirubrobacterales bacterium]